MTIDPEFRRPPPSEGHVRRLRTAGAVGMAIAAFAFGWLVRSPAPPEGGADEASAVATTTSTTQAVEDETPSTTAPPATTTTTAPLGAGSLSVPLGEAVPGFADVITLERWAEATIDVVRWRPSQPAPETIEAFRDEPPSWFSGLDISGTWYAIQGEDGVLTVRRLGSADAGPGWLPDLRAVGVRVVSLAWHDTEPGQLAWLTCSRTLGEPGILFRLDVADGTAEPSVVRRIENACSEQSSGWLQHWGDWGFAVGAVDDETHRVVLLDPDGNELSQVDADVEGAWMIAGSSNGAIWLVDPMEPSPSWALVSPDGRSTTPVPGLFEGEWLEDARWSPNGAKLALSVREPGSDGVVVRIVDMPTGTVVAELAEPDWEAVLGGWTADSRFLVFERWTCLDGCHSFEPEVWVLMFYDTATDAITEVDLPTPRNGGWGRPRLASATAPAKLVAHYPLDGDAADASGFGHDGVVSGATPTADRFGTPGAAYAFDGENDRIEVDIQPQLHADPVSIAAWVQRPDSATPRPVGGWRNVVSYGAGGHVLGIEGAGAVVGGLQGTGAECEFIGNDPVFDGDWHHVAMTRDANWMVRLYVDGVLQSVAPATPSPTGGDVSAAAVCAVGPAFGAFLRIGADPGNSQYFYGSIDDVHIYGGTLTDDEVASLAGATP